MKKGMTADILRPVTDSTNDGLTGKSGRLCFVTVLGLGHDCEIFAPDKDAPAVLVETYMGQLRAVPCDNDGKRLPGWYMFGGNFVWTSDSRFRKIAPYPIPVHDRLEVSR